ncbi:MAG: hypothetical protein KGJ13_10005 [Patescibacteria group bacterium]|nr:hypothetical protein [Patescibacteria group bacterium]
MTSKAKSKKATPPAKLTGASTSTAVATVPMNLPGGVKLTRRLTMPSLVLKVPGVARILAIADAMRVSSVPGKVNKDGVQEKPATVCTVGDVETGEQFTLLVPAVLKSTLERDYPNDEYVGKCFYIRNEGKREGKRHIDFTIAEVDVSGLKAA